MRDTPFVPTHTLKHDIPELHLKAGTPLRQVNPFAGHKNDHLMCLEESDWNGSRQPWIFLPDDLEALENWPEERQKMIEKITKRR